MITMEAIQIEDGAGVKNELHDSVIVQHITVNKPTHIHRVIRQRSIKKIGMNIISRISDNKQYWGLIFSIIVCCILLSTVITQAIYYNVLKKDNTRYVYDVDEVPVYIYRNQTLFVDKWNNNTQIIYRDRWHNNTEIEYIYIEQEESNSCLIKIIKVRSTENYAVYVILRNSTQYMSTSTIRPDTCDYAWFNETFTICNINEIEVKDSGTFSDDTLIIISVNEISYMPGIHTYYSGKYELHYEII